MRSLIPTVAWGVFCACSWTWCIGMFLPAIMIERFGWPGFAVFAIPNVIGCAGFGYVLARRSRSQEMVERHGKAMVGFSIVAIAFHMFFITLLFTQLTPDAQFGPTGAMAAAAIVFAAGLAISWLEDRAWLILAGLVYLLSLAAFAAVGFSAWDRLMQPGEQPLSELAWLAPIITIGFLLCPYLDLTFHRALQQSPSRHAFGVFGLTFSVMIVFTCFLWFADSPGMHLLAAAHIAAQATFTVGAHLREVRKTQAITKPRVRWGLILLPLAASPFLPLAQATLGDQPSTGTDMYLRFLVFYGLAFPAYVLLFIGPVRPVALKPAALLIALIAVLVLSPLYEIAFLHQRAWAMIAPTALAIAWLVLRRLRSTGRPVPRV